MKELVGELAVLAQKTGRPLKLMEVCGTHTVEIFRHGIRSVLPGTVSLLSGPGCPVCVTSIRDVDAAISIAKMPGTVMATFGDMMRVPGGRQSLLEARSEGADVAGMHSTARARRAMCGNSRSWSRHHSSGFTGTVTALPPPSTTPCPSSPISF